MKLTDLLSQKRAVVVKGWREAILNTYPVDTRRFLKKQKDRFSNPVGYAITRGVETLFDELLKGTHVDSGVVSPVLDEIIRIRAVQDFAPSETMEFLFILKHVIRENLKEEIRENRLINELLALESRIDDLSLLAFDILMKCRETIFEIRAAQARNQVSGLLKRAGLVCEIPDLEVHPEELNHSEGVT